MKKLTNEGWLNPVKAKAYDSIKPGETNTLRVVWSGPPTGIDGAADPTVQVFINDQPVFKFKVKPNGNRQIGLAVRYGRRYLRVQQSFDHAIAGRGGDPVCSTESCACRDRRCPCRAAGALNNLQFATMRS